MSVETSREYLTAPEVRFLDAALARLIPADALGPGAKEAGVTVFIDRQLASAWGVHGRNYRMGPWRQGTPQQGWQSPLTPQQMYRTAIREIDGHCGARHGKPFHALPDDVQDGILHALEDGTLDLPSLESRDFFALLWRNVQEGFFADPRYGGNRDKIGWRLIGFPGVAAANYTSLMAARNVAYRVEPVSLADIDAGHAQVDAQGFAVHAPLRTNDEAP